MTDKIHERLRQARENYFKVTKYFPPEANVAHLPEYDELNLAKLHHDMQCDCESLSAAFFINQTLRG
jgi:hypothetical protein